MALHHPWMLQPQSAKRLRHHPADDQSRTPPERVVRDRANASLHPVCELKQSRLMKSVGLQVQARPGDGLEGPAQW